MEDYRGELEEQLKVINTLVDSVRKNNIRLEEVPDYLIRINKSNGCYQYHLVNKQTNEKKYVKSKEVPNLKKIAQKQYNQKVYEELLKMKSSLEIFLKNYDVNKIDQLYNKMSEGRKRLINPIIETDEIYINNWLEDEYETMTFFGETEFYTNKGVRVRSKSELIIANFLEEFAIPYKYEKPIILKGIGQVRPDFICLNTRIRKEYLWEHFGMMDDADYANKNVIKLNAYHQNGFYPGKNMITSFETSKQPISSRIIKNIIQQYLC